MWFVDEETMLRRCQRLSATIPARGDFLPYFPFDAVYVINLDRRADRWSSVQRQLRRAKIDYKNVQRVAGVVGTELDAEQLHRRGTLTDIGLERFRLPTEEKLFGMDLTPGALGCALSHRKVWSMIVEKRQQCALILEDDVEFHPAVSKQFMDLWNRVPDDWDLVYLGGLDLLASQNPTPRPYIAEGVRHAYKGHRELTAYVLHAKSATRCLELSSAMTFQIDTHIANIFEVDPKANDEFISDPKSYVFQPSMAIQLAKFGTDVQKHGETNPPLTDAARRMREFVGGGTSVR